MHQRSESYPGALWAIDTKANRYSLVVGDSSGAETENRWARLDMIERRMLAMLRLVAVYGADRRCRKSTPDWQGNRQGHQ